MDGVCTVRVEEKQCAGVDERRSPNCVKDLTVHTGDTNSTHCGLKAKALSSGKTEETSVCTSQESKVLNMKFIPREIGQELFTGLNYGSNCAIYTLDWTTVDCVPPCEHSSFALCYQSSAFFTAKHGQF